MPTCPKCGKSYSIGDKFCEDCGFEFPQIKKCIKCNAELSLTAKFCKKCGTPQDGSIPVSSGVNMGDKNVIAGDVIGTKIAGDSVGQKIMGNAIYNAIQDETKKVISCAVCGKHLANDNAYTCPNCGKTVCEVHFEQKLNCCNSCKTKSAKKIIVDKSGNGDFTTISEAVAFATNGTTIIVKPGTYREHFTLDKKINLCGEPDENNESPIIWDDTTIVNSVITISENSEISNLRILGYIENIPNEIKEKIQAVKNTTTNNTPPEVFWPKNIFIQSSCTISGVEINYSAGYGIAVANDCEKVTIKKCNFHDNIRSGIYVANKSNVFVEMSSLHENRVACIFHSSNISLWNTDIFKNQVGISCESSRIQMEFCTIYGNEFGCNLFDKAFLIAKTCSFGLSKFFQNNIQTANCLPYINHNGDTSIRSNKSFLTIENCLFFDKCCLALRNPSSTNITNCRFEIESEVEASGILVYNNEQQDSSNILIVNTIFNNLKRALDFNTKLFKGSCSLKNSSFNDISSGIIYIQEKTLWDVIIDSCTQRNSFWTFERNHPSLKFINLPKEILVSKNKSCEFSSIAEAIQFAKEKSTIYVDYGIYYEHFSISKPITMIGKENEKGKMPIVKESLKKADICIDVKAQATLKNLCIESDDKGNEFEISKDFIESHNAIRITSDVILENISICNWGCTGVRVTGEGATVQITDCFIGENFAGIFIEEKAKCDVIGCKISSNTCGIGLSNNGTCSKIYKCIVEYNKFGGITCEEGSLVHIYECEINHNDGFGINIFGRGTIIKIFDGNIKRNKNEGILVAEGGQCSLEKSCVFNNAKGIIADGPDTQIYAANSEISLNDEFGLYIDNKAYGFFEKCEITSNSQDGIYIRGNNTIANIKESKIQDNDGNGISFTNGSTGNIEICNVTNNGKENFFIEEGCSPCIDMDTLFSSSTQIKEKADSQIKKPEENIISANPSNKNAIKEKSNPSIASTPDVDSLLQNLHIQMPSGFDVETLDDDTDL